jgi:hypothetical protein
LEQVGQGFGVVAMTGQTGLQVIQIAREYTLDEFWGERLLPDLMAFLERPGEVVLDLKRSDQTVSEERERRFRQDVLPGLRGGALFEQPGNIGTLLPFDTVQ